MKKLRLGKVDYLNCLPVYNALEEEKVSLNAKIVKGTPAQLNQKFLKGQLDVTPISSIEYARHADDCLIVPNLSISADGRVASILLFSKIPVTELEGKKVALTNSSATSVVLLKILLEHYYHVNVQFEVFTPDLPTMLEACDAALLIGDDALMAAESARTFAEDALYITDLGEVWKQFTGEAMVYAVWVVHRDFAEKHSEQVLELQLALATSKEIGMQETAYLVEKAKKNFPYLSHDTIEDYFATIRYDFDEKYRHSLMTFYDYAYKSGLIQERVKLVIWGETGEHSEYIKKSS